MLIKSKKSGYPLYLFFVPQKKDAASILNTSLFVACSISF